MGTPLGKRAWFLTWTTYGTWLPGDERGFVSPKFDRPKAEERHNKIHSEYDQNHVDLKSTAELKLTQDEVFLSTKNATSLWEQFQETARFRQWEIQAVAIMRAHIHIGLMVEGDPEPEAILKDLKSYGSRRLNGDAGAKQKWWTEQGSKRKVRDTEHLAAVMEYVRNQESPLVVWVRNDSETGTVRV